MKKDKLVFVIPAFNEEKTIGATLDDIQKSFPKALVLVVNDGSHDQTRSIARDKGATVLTHVINRGLGATLATGIQAALNHDAEYIVTFDADLQHMSEDVNRLLEPLKKGETDAVIGSRFLKKEHLEMMPLVKKIGNTFLTGATNILAGTKITDSQSGLRAFNRAAAETLLVIGDKYEVSSLIIQELGEHKMRLLEIPIKAIYDDYSKTKGTNVQSGVKIFWHLMLRKIGAE